MDNPQSNFSFRMMALWFRARDFFSPPTKILSEIDLSPDSSILDYGCGPGSFSIAAAQIVKASGKVYALDIHPLAIEQVKKAAVKNGLQNTITTILSNCTTGLDNETIDVVLFYDVFHALSEQFSVLQELHRILKDRGRLSFSDHHLTEDTILHEISKDGLFQLVKKGNKTYTFAKQI
ncbi:MAG: class I SAM-dependent methyltransferase [Candidatus Thorarchaeota archaeon]